MQVLTAFELWGYSPKSSGGFQTISALKSYGLLDDDGVNSDRKVKLTNEARHYFLDERDEHKNALLAKFALTPPLFKSLWEDDGWKEGIPADTVARSRLKLDRQMNDQSSRSLLSIFKENVQFAGLHGSASVMGHAEEIAEQTEDDPQFVETRPNLTVEAKARPQTVQASIALKPIVFDMETVSGQYQFDNADDLTDFISKLEKIKALLPAKTTKSS